MDNMELNNLRTKIKSNFRVVETDKFYIQEKQPNVGWSYDVKKQYEIFPVWFHILMILLCCSSLATIFAFITIFITWNPLFFIISCLTTIGFIYLIMFCSSKEKDFSFNYTDIRNAEKKIDSLVEQRIEEKIKEKKLKEKKKYHYFYTTKQLRKEKLLKLNKK